MRAVCLCLVAIALALASPVARALNYIETPSLAADVAAGKLPPVAGRLPDNPRVINLAARGRKPGRHGGTLRMLVGKQKDIRLIPYYSYSRLVGYTQDLEIVPDILESYNVSEGRIFTFKIRKGHKWSDGHPFTSEDFRYVWEDVFSHPRLSRGGLRQSLLVNGKGPRFEVIDTYTVRYTWDAPNPDFLPALAAPSPLYLALPAHYLKQFHIKYRDAKELKKLVARERLKDWVRLHLRKARMKKAENPDLPVLDAWVNTIAPPSKVFIFRRNPFYHRVDENGRQLPYIDKIQITTGSKQLIAAKVAAGESDFQARNLTFEDYTHLKAGEKRNNYKVLLWRSGSGSTMSIYPNLNVKDKVWRKVLRDVRFRRALSLAISRHEINQIFFFGLARESADTVLPESPLFEPQFESAWSNYDPALANRLLDEMGLRRKNKGGYRLLPDGRIAEIIVETAGESTQQSDILELITDYWRAIGIKLITKNSQREVLRRRAIAGLTQMSVWPGMDNGLAAPQMNPSDLIPSSSSQLQWPQWGIYGESGGRKGERPDLAACLLLLKHANGWKMADGPGQKAEAWREMLQIYTDQVFSIGTVNGVPQPIVVSNHLQNVPEKGIYAFSPTSYFGIYMPDTFWLDNQPQEN